MATIFASLQKVFLDLDLNENTQMSWPQCVFSSASHNIICNIPSIFIYFCRLRIAVCSALTMLGLGLLSFKPTLTEDGRSMTTFYYYSVNHQSGLQRNTFSKLSHIFLIHQNVPQIMSFHLRYMMVS